MAQIFCSTRRLVAEKQLPTRRLLEGVNIYQTSSSRKIALLDVQQNFYWMPSRTFTRRLVDQMIWANIFGGSSCSIVDFWHQHTNLIPILFQDELSYICTPCSTWRFFQTSYRHTYSKFSSYSIVNSLYKSRYLHVSFKCLTDILVHYNCNYSYLNDYT